MQKISNIFYLSKVMFNLCFFPFHRTASGNDIWGWHDAEDDYAIVGLTTGTSFVRITDPENVEVLGFLPTHTIQSTWRDMKVVNNHAFIVSEALNHGMQVNSTN